MAQVTADSGSEEIVETAKSTSIYELSVQPLTDDDLPDPAATRVDEKVFENRGYYSYETKSYCEAVTYNSIGEPYTRLELNNSVNRITNVLLPALSMILSEAPQQEFWFEDGLNEKSSINQMLSLMHAGHVSLFDVRALAYVIGRKYGSHVQFSPNVRNVFIERCPRTAGSPVSRMSIIFNSLDDLCRSLGCLPSREALLPKTRKVPVGSQLQHTVVLGTLLEERIDGCVVRRAIFNGVSEPGSASRDAVTNYAIQDIVLWCETAWSSDFRMITTSSENFDDELKDVFSFALTPRRKVSYRSMSGGNHTKLEAIPVDAFAIHWVAMENVNAIGRGGEDELRMGAVGIDIPFVSIVGWKNVHASTARFYSRLDGTCTFRAPMLIPSIKPKEHLQHYSDVALIKYRMVTNTERQVRNVRWELPEAKKVAKNISQAANIEKKRRLVEEKVEKNIKHARNKGKKSSLVEKKWQRERALFVKNF